MYLKYIMSRSVQGYTCTLFSLIAYIQNSIGNLNNPKRKYNYNLIL